MRFVLHRIVLFAACTAAAPAAFASVTLPPMKPGFWQATMVMHMNMAGQPPDTDNTPNVVYSCLSAQTIAEAMKQMGGAIPGCAFDIAGSGGSYTITTSCASIGGMPGKLTGSGTMEFNGDREMIMKDSSSMVSPSMSMKTDMSDDSKWVGQCPADVAPGDFGKMVNGVFQKAGNYADMAKIVHPQTSGN